MASMNLDEDVIDDLLYLARIADISELQATLNQASQELHVQPCDILVAARDGATGNTALHMAAANGHTEAIKFLVSVTIQPPTDNPVSGLLQSSSMLVNVPNSSGNTSLHWAALNGHLEAVKLLVDSGADVLAKNNAGHDVAYEAELAGKEVVVNWLLGAQKDDCILEKEEEEEEEDVEIQEGVTQNGYASAG